MNSIKTSLTFWTEAVAPITAILQYTPKDPFAVTITFSMDEDSVTWVFARDIFQQAFAEGEAGVGDVKVTLLHGRFLLCLSSPSGKICLHFPRLEVEAFITETYTLVPLGGEEVQEALEAMLEDLLQ